MKIAVNRCHGGFGLSEKAIKRYAEIKGIMLYPEYGRFNTTYWTVPPAQRIKECTSEEWKNFSMEERHAYNKKYDGSHIYDRNIERNDSALIQVIEELGEDANGEYAQLEIVDIPDDVKWQIDEYDGAEWVAEVHRTW